MLRSKCWKKILSLLKKRRKFQCWRYSLTLLEKNEAMHYLYSISEPLCEFLSSEETTCVIFTNRGTSLEDLKSLNSWLFIQNGPFHLFFTIVLCHQWHNLYKIDGTSQMWKTNEMYLKHFDILQKWPVLFLQIFKIIQEILNCGRFMAEMKWTVLNIYEPESIKRLAALTSSSAERVSVSVLKQAITKGNWWSLIGCKNGHGFTFSFPHDTQSLARDHEAHIAHTLGPLQFAKIFWYHTCEVKNEDEVFQSWRDMMMVYGICHAWYVSALGPPLYQEIVTWYLFLMQVF